MCPCCLLAASLLAVSVLPPGAACCCILASSYMGGNHEAKSIQQLVVASKIMPGLVVQGVLDFAGPCVQGVLDPIVLLRVSANTLAAQISCRTLGPLCVRSSKTVKGGSLGNG